LNHERPWVRYQGARALVRIDRTGCLDLALPALAALPKEEREDDGIALRALGEVGAEAVPALVEWVQGGGGRRRRLAAEDLGTIGPAARDAVPALREAMGHDDVKVQVAAAGALSRIAPDAASASRLAEVLLRALRSGDEDVRFAAA